MHKKKAVFLFGAGAAMSWGGPSTPELTKLILDGGFNITGQDVKVTRFIYDKLLECGYNEQQANFETIINVIEELIVYYSNFNYALADQSKKLPSLIRCFTIAKFNELLNFSIAGNGRAEHGFELEIPAGTLYGFSFQAIQGETPPQFYFQHLISEILTAINDRISDYAYHTKEYSRIDENSPCSRLFVSWIKNIEEHHSLRLYTLNYDRLFKVLLEKSGISVFEGYDCGECIDNKALLRANVKRILSDDVSNIHYNLHGSAFWQVQDLDKELLPNAELVLTSFPDLPVNNYPASFQVEKGKTMMITNIITGYQKAQKGMITPVKQMQSAFDRDCCVADTIYIVGYSFGDEHINESIKTAIRHNNDVKIVIIDPGFKANNRDFDLALRFLPFKQQGSFNCKKTGDNEYTLYNGLITAYVVKFDEFLELQSRHFR